LPWQSGDNVVTLANEFPSNQYPWLNLASRGVETRRVAVDESGVDLRKVIEAMDSRTRVVWLLGPEGAGLLYIRRAHLDGLRPINVGWNSVTQGNDYSRIELNVRECAARYEGGSHNLVGSLALGASLHLLESFGLGPRESAVGQRVLQITDLACDQLARCGAQIVSRRDAEHSSGIVAFDWPGTDPQRARKHCLANHVVLSCRGGHLRISPHAYNNADDIQRLIDVLRSP
jgi:selenocysteine lyase/cysteine desulfurase